MTRAMVRKLLMRAASFFLVTMAVLLVMNFSTNRRLEAEKQQTYQTTLGRVLPAERYTAISLASFQEMFPTVKSAYAAYDEKNTLLGYVIDVQGASGEADPVTRMGFSEDGKTLLSLCVLSADAAGQETAAVQSEDFYRQFQNIHVPAALLADLPDEDSTDNAYPAISGLQDGTFREQLDEADDAGYRDYVAIVVEGGRIVQVTWDAIQTDGGNNRAKASVDGEFVLDDNTVIWAAQAYAMQNKLIEVQDPAKIAIKSDGTTEVVQGVTVNVNAFVKLANKCIEDSQNGNAAAPLPTAPAESGITSVPKATAAQETDAAPDGTSSSFNGSEDGVVKNDAGVSAADMIDGFPASDIKTRINEAEGAQEASRSVVSSVNRAYSFLLEYLKGRE